MNSFLFSNINWVFDAAANWMVLRLQILVRTQYPNTTPCDSNTERTHWLFRPATLKNDRRLWELIVESGRLRALQARTASYRAAYPAARPSPAGAPARCPRGPCRRGSRPMRVTAAAAGLGITIEPMIQRFCALEAVHGYERDNAFSTSIIARTDSPKGWTILLRRRRSPYGRGERTAAPKGWWAQCMPPAFRRNNQS